MRHHKYIFFKSTCYINAILCVSKDNFRGLLGIQWVWHPGAKVGYFNLASGSLSEPSGLNVSPTQPHYIYILGLNYSIVFVLRLALTHWDVQNSRNGVMVHLGGIEFNVIMTSDMKISLHWHQHDGNWVIHSSNTLWLCVCWLKNESNCVFLSKACFRERLEMVKVQGATDKASPIWTSLPFHFLVFDP